MKWPILFSGVAVVMVFSFCYWFISPTEKVAAQKPPDQIEPAREFLPIPAPIVSTAAGTIVVPTAPVQKITSNRRRIFDSPDIMRTIDEVRRSGTSDEKEWAVSLLVSCVQVFATPPEPIPDSSISDQVKPVSVPDNNDLAAERKLASDSLGERCRGVKQLNYADRAALKRDLMSGGPTNRSVLAQLTALTESGDDRWNGEQAQLITNSLYGGDPIVARQAFATLLSALDLNAPGGKDRQQAFLYALGPIYYQAPLSEFERLQGCISLSWCGSNWGPPDPNFAPSPAVAELAEKYRAAVDTHMDARSILAIR